MDLDAEFIRLKNRIVELEKKTGVAASPAGQPLVASLEARLRALTTAVDNRLRALEGRIAAVEGGQPAQKGAEDAPNTAPATQTAAPSTKPS